MIRRAVCGCPSLPDPRAHRRLRRASGRCSVLHHSHALPAISHAPYGLAPVLRAELADRCRVAQPLLGGVGPLGIPFIAPRVFQLQRLLTVSRSRPLITRLLTAGACPGGGLFPFRLAGQTRPGPPAIGYRLKPHHTDHREIGLIPGRLGPSTMGWLTTLTRLPLPARLGPVLPPVVTPGLDKPGELPFVTSYLSIQYAGRLTSCCGFSASNQSSGQLRHSARASRISASLLPMTNAPPGT